MGGGKGGEEILVENNVEIIILFQAKKKNQCD